ncbi:uncharacterized protein IUM83_12875 [Phytophthora cinnamomi]|uniref:uncharacterized protein n=1 Tax=Phytophthora cinnamomi TaxID=4785 RepID=UPI0035596F31|nr:hypothetical protein IUM83_12875 [Phytophthora cinnamomi]
MFASIDILLEGTRLTIEAALWEASLQQPGESGTVLELNGQTHEFGMLPGGLLSTAGASIFGEVRNIKAYKGYTNNETLLWLRRMLTRRYIKHT